MLRKKSLLALLLFLCMVVGILPATVFAAGQYVPENPRWSGYGNQVMWDKPANASGSTYLEYEAQLVLNGQVLQTESVEIDRWVFFDSKNITQSKDAYTLKVRARQIYLTGDPDGSYTVWKRDAWGDWAIGGNTGGGEGPTPPHEHSYGDWQKDETQHWKECRCGEKTEVGNHTFGDWTITKEPTTTETGSRERTCSVCEYTQEETIPVHTHDVHDKAWKYDDTNHWQECSCGEKLNVANHAYGEWRVTKPATETEEGSKARDCTVCDYVQTETIPMLEHEHSYGDWQKDETQHWKECRCGEKTEVGNHTFGDWTITKEPTTTETGSRERTCSVCEYTQEETIPVHTHDVHDKAWKYDDTNHWQECSCGEKLNVANHAYGEWRVTKPATETEEGSKARDCTVCDYVQTETIPMLEHEHSYGDWQKDETQHWKECRCGEKTEVGNHTFGDWTITKEPTTTETGSRERTCSVCEYTQEETIPVHTHDVHDKAWKYDDTNHWQECSCGEKLNVANHAYGEWRVTKPATETEEGSKARDCTVCDYVQTETIPMLEHEHSYGDWQKDETQHWKECRCGEKTEVGNHTFGDWTITKEPTTTETGSRERTCSVCEYTQEETIPVHTHDVHDKAWKYDDTNHWQECSCGEKLNVANHAYGEWRVTKPATETEEGSKARDCTVCDHVQTETIPMLEHEHSYGDWQKDKTQHWKECRCGEKTEVGNHTFDDWTITKEPTTTETGSRERTCSVCEYTQKETIPVHEHSIHDEAWKYDDTEHWQECSCGERLNVANHIYGDWRETKPATETEAGSRERDCTVCDYVQTETIPMLEHEHSYGDWQKDETQHWQECSCGEKLNVANHTYGDWKVTKEATETEAGSRERGCTVCKYVQVEDIPMLEHKHGIHDETWKYDKTQHWQECSCGEKLNVANHTYGDWKTTKRPLRPKRAPRSAAARSANTCRLKPSLQQEPESQPIRLIRPIHPIRRVSRILPATPAAPRLGTAAIWRCGSA